MAGAFIAFLILILILTGCVWLLAQVVKAGQEAKDAWRELRRDGEDTE